MTPEQYEKAASIFLEASRCDGDRRDAFIDQACGDDRELRAAVRRLIEHDGDPHSIIDDRTPGRGAEILLRYLANATSTSSSAHAGAAASAGEDAADVIGRYKLIRKLGEGGFGTVYLAEQSEPVRREVALKIIKLGMDTKQVIARFEAERQALAMMDHLGIAKVLDAGATESGRPYFVMELVRGIPITEYCDQHRLQTRERIELFIRACRAVQHAHQKGVIHRDLKPSNVLVSAPAPEGDGRPGIKIIDFGIAKAVSQRLTDRTMHTEHGQLIGTPAYMSPEQAGAGGLDIDTRSDIYALGVLIYELLTGTTPFDTRTLQSMSYYEIQRAIREDEPPKPSTRLSTMGDDAADVASQRGEHPAHLSRALRGDLDWIVMKALEKDRSRRYETANGLAMDLQRYLDDEPVIAGPPGAMYRARKLIKRNKGPFTVAAVIVLLLVAGVTGTTIGMLSSLRNAAALDAALVNELAQRQLAQANAVRAEAEAAEAKRQSEIARAVNDFLNHDLLSTVAPSSRAGEGRDVLMRDVLDEASTRLDEAATGGRFADKPLVEAAVRDTVGQTYWRLGEHEPAESHLQRGLELRQRELGERHYDTSLSLNHLANLYRAMARYDEAADLYQRTIDVRTELLGPGDPDTLVIVNNLAGMLRSNGQYARAASLIERTRAAAEGTLEPDDTQLMNILENQAGLYKDLARYEEAAAIYEQLLQSRRTIVDPQELDIARSMNNLAVVYARSGRSDEAADLYAEALEIYTRLLTERHPTTLVTMANFGYLQLQRERLDDAEQMLGRAVQLHREVLGDDHRGTIITMSRMATLYKKLDRFDDARALYLEALRHSRARYGPTFPGTMVNLNDLAVLHLGNGQASEGEAFAAEAVELAQSNLAPDNYLVGVFLATRGLCRLELGRHAEAEEDFLASFRVLDGALGTDHGETQETIRAMVRLYESWHEAEPEAGHDAGVAEWRAKLVDEGTAPSSGGPP